MGKLFIPCILSGGGRMGGVTEKIADYVKRQMEAFGFETELVDVWQYAFSATLSIENSSLVEIWKKTMARADGFVFIVPEHNHGYPGELKLFLDLADEGYAKKPIAIFGVSETTLGGPRVVEQVRLLAIELHMVPTWSAVYFTSCASLFDGNGKIRDEVYTRRSEETFQELAWYAEALRRARTDMKEVPAGTPQKAAAPADLFRK